MALALAILCAALLFVALFGVRRFLGAACENGVLLDVLSPDGAREAIVFRRNCGATTAFSTQVSVLERRASLADEDSGNVFVSDGEGRLSVTWTGARELLVRAPSTLRIFRSESRMGDVVVRYAPSASTP
jgi:hypothetical protein